MIKAVLFDADGVLVDACELHYVAFNRALATMGWNISPQEHTQTYNGLPTQKKLDLLTETKGFPEDWHKAVHGLKQEFTWQAIDDCLLYDCEKRQLLLELKEQGIKIAVCSNSLHKSLQKMLASIGILDLVDLILGNDDVKAPKPDPEMYLAAAKMLSVDIAQCAIIEDSPVGLQAAYASKPGQVIAVQGPREVNITLLKQIRTAMKEAA
ncbi:MAG TPA: HAD family phosphatase [Fimbriimonadaceae bacterium]|jgi:HAD superfamily hydrolase (TIGR01509 family)